MEDSEERYCDLMVQIIFSRSGGDETVVHVVFESVVVPGIQGGKDVVHKPLHCGRTVCGAKGHDSGGIESFCGFQC